MNKRTDKNILATIADYYEEESRHCKKRAGNGIVRPAMKITRENATTATNAIRNLRQKEPIVNGIVRTAIMNYGLLVQDAVTLYQWERDVRKMDLMGYIARTA